MMVAVMLTVVLPEPSPSAAPAHTAARHDHAAHRDAPLPLPLPCYADVSPHHADVPRHHALSSPPPPSSCRAGPSPHLAAVFRPHSPSPSSHVSPVSARHVPSFSHFSSLYARFPSSSDHHLSLSGHVSSLYGQFLSRFPGAARPSLVVLPSQANFSEINQAPSYDRPKHENLSELIVDQHRPIYQSHCGEDCLCDYVAICVLLCSGRPLKTQAIS